MLSSSTLPSSSGESATQTSDCWASRLIIALYSLELVVWLVPNLYAGALSVCFVGFFLGPIYPILMNHCGRVIPPDLISGAIGWIACWGAAGAAVFPFITGAIASKAGIVSLLPV